jgi:murein DD-endopeptidase MepM/ murein hydrolase activator NlpD
VRRRTAQLCLALALAVPAAAQASPGGAPSAPPPVIDAVKCKRDCAGGAARAGSKLLVTGSGMANVIGVEFLGSPLDGDEVQAGPHVLADDRLTVTVPEGAATGPLAVLDELGQSSEPSAPVAIDKVAVPKRTRGPIATVVSGRKVFVDGVRAPTLTYRLQTDVPAEVTVTVVRQGSGRAVKTFDEGRVEPGAEERVAWRGRRQGRYAFVVEALGTDGVAATTAQSPAADAFVLLGHKFPIRGKHDYGSSGGRFGAGRTGHSHQGQDVFANCGTPLVAARGGVVKMKRYQSLAGNYLVIDGARTGVDYMYAHLRDPALVEQGDRVHTGDPIGFVGDTGDAQGCHLHFEMWDAPGWYSGGSPFDPLPQMRAWDQLS